mmetsp:Transcript_21912/g.75301  ORF Transcript_21912/g.75301 Transcript_21912/m.75301 type:complete len:544 (-) Transcript_21912:68-1699(-)
MALLLEHEADLSASQLAVVSEMIEAMSDDDGESECGTPTGRRSLESKDTFDSTISPLTTAQTEVDGDATSQPARRRGPAREPRADEPRVRADDHGCVEEDLDEDTDDDDGFTIDPRSPRREGSESTRRTSISDAVFVLASPAASRKSLGPKAAPKAPAGRPRAASDRPSSAAVPVHRRTSEGAAPFPSIVGGLPPRRQTMSSQRCEPIAQLDIFLDQKRRAKATEDSSEFERALAWVVSTTGSNLSLLPETSADAEDAFGAALRDGVLLCELLNVMRPGTARFSRRPRVAFERLDNVTAFLRGCRALGVLRADTFDAQDLSEVRDLSKVYETLLALARAVAVSCPDYGGVLLVSAKREETARRGNPHKWAALRSKLSTPKWTPTPTPIARSCSANSFAYPLAFSSPMRIPPGTAYPSSMSSISMKSFDSDASTVSVAPPGVHRHSPEAIRPTSPPIRPKSPSIRPPFNEAPDEALTIEAWIDACGLSAYAGLLSDVAADLDDLKEMTDADVEEVLAAAHMPKIKQRRFRKALFELGAAVTLLA